MAQPDLSDADITVLQTLFEKMGTAFMRSDAAALRTLLAESPEHDGIADTLKRELKEAQYLDFQVGKPQADDQISPKRHIVKVILDTKVLYHDDSRSPDSHAPIANRMNQSFTVERQADGSFKIVNSSFFDNMGRRSGGMRLAVDVLAAVMLLCALLAFWVWMGSEAWWIRPRSRLWRIIVAVPIFGALVFFFFRYMPDKWRKPKIRLPRH